MKNVKLATVILAVFAVPQVFAEVTTRAGNCSGRVIGIDVEASTRAEVQHWKPDADTDGDHPPFVFDGEWTFTWDTEDSGSVDFFGVINFGDHFTLTDAGRLGGISKQVFFGLAHNVKGTANWDSAARTLTFKMLPEGRDDARASTVTQTREAECEKVKGMFAGKACSAFKKTSPGLEGLDLSFSFSEDLSSFEGVAILIQFGGKGMAKSEARTTTEISGNLAAK